MATLPRLLFLRLFLDEEEEPDLDGEPLLEGPLEGDLEGEREGEREGDVPRPPMDTGFRLLPARLASGPLVG